MNYIDVSHLVGHQSEAKVENLILQLLTENDQKDQAFGTAVGVVLHHTAGNYHQVFDAYQFCIAFDSAHKKAYVVKMLDWSQKGKHVWGYNTGMVGISLCAMADGVPYAPEQIELMCVLAAEICAWKRLDPRGHLTLPAKTTQGDNLVATGGTMQMAVLADHAHFAHANAYYPERTDIETIYAHAVARTLEIYDALKAHTREFEFKPLLG
jgi:hypothetical protein